MPLPQIKLRKTHLYKKGHIEKDFQRDFFDQLEKLNWICYHVPDIGMSDKFLDGILVDPEWRVIFIEFKQILADTFNVSKFEDSQVILLGKLARRPLSEAYVAVYSQKHKDYAITTFRELATQKNDKWGVKLFTK